MTALAARAVRLLTLPAGLSRWVRPLLLALAAVVTIAVLAVYVFPTRTWIDQRQSIAETEDTLDALAAEREALEARVAELDTDAEIALIARSQYGLVLPGEEAYAVLPAPEQPVELPSVWPFGPLIDDGPIDPVHEGTADEGTADAP